MRQRTLYRDGMRSFAVLILALLTTFGCKTPEEQLVGKPPVGEKESVRRPKPIGETEKREERPEYPDPKLVLETWPYVEDRKTFELTWEGGDDPAPLHLKPDPNSPVIGDAVWEDGEEIGWQNTVVAIYQPKVVRATQEWFVEGPFYQEGYVTDPGYVSETLRKGQPLEVYLYAGAGQCWLGLDDQIFRGKCPPPEKFSGPFQGKIPQEWYQPARKVWWIQVSVEDVTGWFPLDDRVVVDIVNQ